MPSRRACAAAGCARACAHPPRALRSSPARLQGPNVRYVCTAAEFLTEHLPRKSVDLIAMAETLHW